MNILRPMMTLFAAALAACAGPTGDAGGRAPPVESMTRVTPAHGAMGVPVDVRYTITGSVREGEIANLELAFVPRVPGAVLNIEFPASATVHVASGQHAMSMKRAQAAEVYRRTLVVSPRVRQGGSLQVIVSMDMEGGRYFSVFTIPVQPPVAAP